MAPTALRAPRPGLREEGRGRSGARRHGGGRAARALTGIWVRSASSCCSSSLGYLPRSCEPRTKAPPHTTTLCSPAGRGGAGRGGAGRHGQSRCSRNHSRSVATTCGPPPRSAPRPRCRRPLRFTARAREGRGEREEQGPRASSSSPPPPYCCPYRCPYCTGARGGGSAPPFRGSACPRGRCSAGGAPPRRASRTAAPPRPAPAPPQPPPPPPCRRARPCPRQTPAPAPAPSQT